MRIDNGGARGESDTRGSETREKQEEAIAEEEEKEGEKEKREAGQSLRAWSDPPPCSARHVITRQGRREREASKSSYGPPFPLPPRPSRTVSRVILRPRRPLSKLIFY